MWNFGDENASTEQNPIHGYPLPGTYTVRLTVGKGTQTDTETKVDYITVAGTAPESGTAMYIEAIDMVHKKGKKGLIRSLSLRSTAPEVTLERSEISRTGLTSQSKSR